MSNPKPKPTPTMLVILTSHAADSQGRGTGWYLSEFAHAYNIFTQRGLDVVVASPKGGVAPLASVSINMCPDDESQRFLKEKQDLWANTLKVDELVGRTDSFVGCYLPGGYGPMFDLFDDPATQQVLGEFAAANKVIGSVCHGPAALIRTKLPTGRPLLDGCKVTAFPERDDRMFGIPDMLPFVLETEIRRAIGPEGKFEMSKEPLGECVTVDRDGMLVLGQNPASIAGVANAMVDAVGKI